MKLRVLVYNIKGLCASAGKVAAAVGTTEPQLALITECGSQKKLQELAAALKMEPVHGPLPRFRRTPRNALLVREPWQVVKARAVPLPGKGRGGPRGVLAASLRNGDQGLTVFCTHLGLKPRPREQQATEILRLAAQARPPVLIGGDLNELPNEGAAGKFGARYWDAWIRAGFSTGETYPADKPSARIDYLFVSDGVQVERAVVLGSRAAKVASDHLPLVVDLKLEGS